MDNNATLHHEIELYLAAMDIARDGKPIGVTGPYFRLTIVEWEDTSDSVIFEALSFDVPFCANCGHDTRWPVRFCHHCPAEDIERATQEEQS